MAGVDFTTVVSQLGKQIYSDEGVRNIENMAAETWSKIKKSPKEPAGQGFYFNVKHAGNQSGLKAQNELEALATPSYQRTVQGYIRAKVITHTVQWSGLVAKALKGGASSFAPAVALEMDKGLEDAAKFLNQQVFRDGSGLIGRVNGAVSGSTSLTFDAAVKTHFDYQMPIDVYDSALSAKQIDGILISDISTSANTLTLASAQTCDDNGYIYRAAAYDNAPTDGKELNGLPRITDNGSDFATFENIIRSGAGYIPPWLGIEIAASSANLSDDLLQRILENFATYGSGLQPDWLIMSPAQKRKYLSLTLPQVQYSPGANRDTGVKGEISWQGLRCTIDIHCGRDEIYMLNSGCVMKYELAPLSYSDEFGNVVKPLTGYDAGYAYARYYGNLGTEEPRGVIRMTGLATPTL